MLITKRWRNLLLVGNQLRYIFLCFLLSLAEIGASQPASNYIIREYTTENGLPSNGIKGLQWDENTGMLWIATEAGIVRFNGLEFKSFTREGSQNLSSNRILFMVKNVHGDIRAVDENRKVFSVEKNQLIFLKKDSPIGDPTHRKLFNVAISDEMMKEDVKPGTYILPYEQIFPIDDTSSYIVKDGTLIYYSINNDQKIDLPAGSKLIKSAFNIRNDFFILDQQGRIYKIRNDHESFDEIPLLLNDLSRFAPNKVEDVIFGDPGMDYPVLFSQSDAWVLNFNGKEIKTKLIAQDVLPDAMIRHVQYSERQQILFIGTDSKGLLIIKPGKVSSHKKQQRKIYEHNSYYAQIELPDGNILTNEGHVIGKVPFRQDKLPVEGTFQPSVLQIGDSFVWYSQPNEEQNKVQLFCHDFRTGKTKSFSNYSTLENIALAQSGNSVYFFTASGIYKVESDSVRKLKDLAEQYVYMALETAPGIIDIASCGGLLRLHVATNKIDTIFKKPGVCIRTIWSYNGYVFFGTYGKGYYVYKDGVVKQMPLDQSNYLLYTHCFIPDVNGFCWISTNRGLFKVSIEQMVEAYDKNLTEVYYHYIGRNDGMEMTELNGGCSPCALRLRNGTLSFPTMDGLLQIEPTNTLLSLPKGDIYIDEIRIDNAYIDPDSISLQTIPSRTDELVFELTYSAWSNKENIYIEYQLDDTSHWKQLPLSNLNLIRFNNLSPGNHILRVRKVNGFGTDNFTHLTIPFSVEKKWYREWWFFTLQILVIIGLFLAFTQFRTRQLRRNSERLERLVTEKTQELQQQNEVLEKNNSIKTRLISIISHDIITPLKFLTAAGRNLLDKKDQIPPDLREETIREMTNTSQELQSLSMNILNWIKYQNENRRLMKENVNISELTNQVINILKSLAKRKDLQLINDTEDQLAVHTFYEPLKILIYNLISNSISFSEKGEITISTRQTDQEMIITVTDEGIGMKEEQIRQLLAEQTVITSANVDNKRGHGLGFMIIKDLIKMMNASISIDSKPGKGAAISIHLPSNGKTT